MNRSIGQFHENLNRVRMLGGLYQAIDSLTTQALDGTDILRSQIVLSVSALDYYVHEVTRAGMINVFCERRPPTNAYLKFPVSTKILMSGSNGREIVTLFEEEIRLKHSFLSFQQPDKIADAIRLFSECKLWDEVSVHMGMRTKDIKNQLQIIVDRRNKIAHEADLDPSYPGVRWPISVFDVDQTIDFISHICDSIQRVVVL